jgi:hypothetical protein
MPTQAESPPASYSEPYPTYTPPDAYRPAESSMSADYMPTQGDAYFTGAESRTDMPSYSTGPSFSRPLGEPDNMPAYVRVPEPIPGAGQQGGIPPRPVRDSSPLAVPGGDRAWLPFAFAAIVLLLCAVILFFGVSGLPFLTGGGGTASDQPTEEPTEEVVEVLPTETVELEPTPELEPTEEFTPEPTPEPAPVEVTATTTDVLNIRQGPARTTASLGKLPQGTTVTVVGRNEDNSWLQIQIPETANLGWVSAEFVTISGDVNSLPVVQTDGGGGAAPTETPAG